MDKIKIDNYSKQVYYTSIIGLFFSTIFGLGILFAIPCIVYAYHIKMNHSKYSKIKVDQALLFSYVTVLLSLIFLGLEIVLFNL